MTQHLKDASGLDVELGNIASFKADLSLNFKTQILMLKEQDLHGISKITFNEIDFVERNQTVLDLTESDYQANKIDPDQTHFFHLAVKNKKEHIIICTGE